ncbi:nucleotidyltransferase domain-containing protein [Candidatus Woesearchaeota archaeon]|nr:nucleotidyltransferase domain-containing protein [Candidatus Woesearchaeota archaeon]
MKLFTKQSDLLAVFIKATWKALTFREVAVYSRNKSTNYVFTALKDFVKMEIITEQKIGNVIAYKLNNMTKSLNIISHIAEYRAFNVKSLPKKNIEKLLKKINTSYYTCIVTGSYAKGSEKKESDLDIVIICGDKEKPSSILSQIKYTAEMQIPEIHPYVFTESEFYLMLVNKEENYGKEIARNNLIITGAKQYYSILMRAIENGFNG